MKSYLITVYDNKGKKLIEETFQAENDQKARNQGKERLQQQGFTNHTSRVTSELGKLILLNGV